MSASDLALRRGRSAGGALQCADESSHRAAGWVKENLSTTIDSPAIMRGTPFSNSENAVRPIISRHADGWTRARG
jgi:hypothetical protein